MLIFRSLKENRELDPEISRQIQPSGDGSPEGILIEYTPEPFPEAPQDGKTYGRKDGGWYEVNSAGNMDGGTAFSIYGGSLVMDGGNSSIEI